MIVDFDKNHKNRLHRLKPKGYAAGLNAELESLSAFTRPQTLRLRSVPARFKRRKQKTEKSRYLLFIVKAKKQCFTFVCFLLVLCGRAGTDRSLSRLSNRQKSIDF